MKWYELATSSESGKPHVDALYNLALIHYEKGEGDVVLVDRVRMCCPCVYVCRDGAACAARVMSCRVCAVIVLRLFP